MLCFGTQQPQFLVFRIIDQRLFWLSINPAWHFRAIFADFSIARFRLYWIAVATGIFCPNGPVNGAKKIPGAQRQPGILKV